MYRETRRAGICSKTNLFSSRNRHDTALKTPPSRRSWGAPRRGPCRDPKPSRRARPAFNPGGRRPRRHRTLPPPRPGRRHPAPTPTPLLSMRSAHRGLDADPRPRRRAYTGHRAQGARGPIMAGAPSWRRPPFPGARGARERGDMSGGLSRPPAPPPRSPRPARPRPRPRSRVPSSKGPRARAAAPGRPGARAPRGGAAAGRQPTCPCTRPAPWPGPGAAPPPDPKPARAGLSLGPARGTRAGRPPIFLYISLTQL